MNERGLCSDTKLLLQSGHQASSLSPIMQHLCLFHCDQAAFHHLVQHGEEAVDLVLAVDNLDDNGQVLR